MRNSFLPVTCAVVLLGGMSGCNKAVQGSGGADSGTETETGTDSDSSTAGGTDNPTTGGGLCVPGVSIACTCPNGQSGAQVCKADAGGYAPCVCEGGGSESDSDAGTTTSGGSGNTTTEPGTTDQTSAATMTSGMETTTTGEPGTTTGVMCGDPGDEPNEAEAEAVDLGDMNCNDDAKTLMGTLAGDADVDWFTYHGTYMDCGILAPDPTAQQVIMAAGAARLCVFAECDMGPVEFECEGGETMSLSPEDRPGCCNQGDVDFTVNCVDTGDENAHIYIRVDQGPAEVCTDYSVEYRYVAD